MHFKNASGSITAACARAATPASFATTLRTTAGARSKVRGERVAPLAGTAPAVQPF